MIIYGTIGGTTRRVAKRLAAHLSGTPVLAASDAVDAIVKKSPSFVVLASPTYGDSELEPSFERMLHMVDWRRLAGVRYAFCEIGIYTGYEDFGHGLSPQVHRILRDAGLRQAAPDLSLDAVPITDWDLVDAWAAVLKNRLGLGS